jgi:hypothetical protein
MTDPTPESNNTPVDTTPSTPSEHQSASIPPHKQHHLVSVDGKPLVPAEPNDIEVGREIYIRGVPALILHVDWPHVHWRTESMSLDTVKHRSFLTCPHLFSVDPNQRGQPAISVDAYLANQAVAQSLMPAGLVQSVDQSAFDPDFEDEQNGFDEDDDDDGDDDSPFSVEAINTVLRPKLAEAVIAKLSPKNSPRNRSPRSSDQEAAEFNEEQQL